MPFYEYECPACRYYLEVLQKISDKPLKKCPSCGKAGFKRLVSAPVFRLKGSGWYETDFKSDKDAQRNLAKAEREEAKGAMAEAAKPAGDDKASATDKASGKAEATTPAKAATDAKPAAAPARARKAKRVRPPARAAARKKGRR